MALLKFGTIIVGARGTVGGATLSANKGGPYAKQWAKGGNPRSNLQSTGRNFLGRMAQLWQTATAAQRTAWNTYAAAAPQAKTNSLGDTYYVSGFNWFVALNKNLAQAGAAAILAAPVLAVPAAPTVSSFTLRCTASGVGVIRTNVADPNKLMLKAGFLAIWNSQGRIVPPRNPPLLAIKQVQVGGAGDGFWTMSVEQAARYGTTYLGQMGFFWLYNQNAEGRRSAAWTGTMALA